MRHGLFACAVGLDGFRRPRIPGSLEQCRESTPDRPRDHRCNRSKKDSVDTARRSGDRIANHALLLVQLVRRSTRQNRSGLRLVFPKKRPAASIASMAKVNASTADDRLALVTDSSNCRSLVVKGLPFALTMLTRHFPGPCSNAVASSQRDAKVSKGLQLT
jgi:hypothetical protein